MKPHTCKQCMGLDPRMSRWIASGLWIVIAFGLAGPSVGAQELSDLPLKRELPPPPPGPCETVPSAEAPEAVPSDEDRREAERLLGEANRAAILGEREGALELLRAAADLDPASSEVAYRLGRILEDAGQEREALRAFCRHLALEDDGGVNVADARARAERIAPPADTSFSESARSAFEEGVAAFDAGSLETAARHFSRALVEAPDWEDAHYNRGVTYLRMGRIGAAAADLEWYLETDPVASDRARVEAHLEQLAPALAPEYDRRTALTAGLVVPGMGHFYSGRPGAGFLVLATATASAGAGLLHRTVEVQCRSVPVDGECPPAEVLARVEDRPLLVPGLLGAAAITVAGAIHAFRGIERPEARLAFGDGGLELQGAAAPSRKMTPFLALQPLSWAEGGGARATLGVRF